VFDVDLLKKKPIREFLGKRPTLILEEPLVAKLNLNPQVVGVRGVDAALERMKEEKKAEWRVGVRGVDAALERMKEEKKAEWRARGYSESLINMATELAQDWTYRMSEVFAPPELREAAIRYNLPKGLEVASRWIEAIGEAAKR